MTDKDIFRQLTLINMNLLTLIKLIKEQQTKGIKVITQESHA